MNKQAELEQAYWNGFATKCAEMGVDASALTKEAQFGVGAHLLGGGTIGASLGALRKSDSLKQRLKNALKGGAIGASVGYGTGLLGRTSDAASDAELDAWHAFHAQDNPDDTLLDAWRTALTRNNRVTGAYLAASGLPLGGSAVVAAKRIAALLADRKRTKPDADQDENKA